MMECDLCKLSMNKQYIANLFALENGIPAHELIAKMDDVLRLQFKLLSNKHFPTAMKSGNGQALFLS